MDSSALIIGIAGRRGSGKSTMARRLLERCFRLVVWDPMDEHRWIPNRLASVERLEAFLAWASDDKLFAGRYVSEGILEDEFEPVADLVYDYGRMVFGVEEAPMLCTPAALPHQFDRLVRLGRHQGVSLVWTAQRLVEVARRLTAATDYFVLFKHTEPRDLDGIAERCGLEVAREVERLQGHGCLVWDVLRMRLVAVDELVQRLSSLSRGQALSRDRSRDVCCDMAQRPR